MSITPEQIAAYADGELGPDEAAQVEAAMENDPTIAGQIEAHVALRDKLRAHFAPLIDAPIPDRFTALLRPAEADDKVVDLAAARQARAQARPAPTRWMMGGALAASLAIGLILGTQVGRGGDGGSIRTDNGRLIASGALDKALTSQLASAQPGQHVRILLSFRDGAGRYCRGFEDRATAGIACHNGTGWAVERVQATASPTEKPGDYRQAGSATAGIMEAAQNMALEGALDAESEKKARDAGWRR